MPLKHLIENALSLQPSHVKTKELIELCHRMAIVYLRRKSLSGSLNPATFGMSLEDLALDCIAGLFERDERGRFPRLAEYYRGVAYADLDETDLLGMTRRLTFSKINDELYRSYRQQDPGLHKLIRNLKSAASALGRLVYQKDEWLIGFGKDFNESLPGIPPEILEMHVAPIITDAKTARAIILKVIPVFADQSLYKKTFPLVSFARCVRDTLVRLEKREPEDDVPGSTLRDAEILEAINTSIHEVRREMYNTYVGKGKVTGKAYASYFAALEEFLETEFVGRDGKDTSLLESLKKQIPGLGADKYRSCHRTHLEYLLKLTRQSLYLRIRKEM